MRLLAAKTVLKAVGLSELITTSLEDYEALALRLARAALPGGMKEKLARNRKTYPFFDTRRFTRHIEFTYKTMWRTHQDGRSPIAFAVERALDERQPNRALTRRSLGLTAANRRRNLSRWARPQTLAVPRRLDSAATLLCTRPRCGA